MGPWPRMRPVGSVAAIQQHHGGRCRTQRGGCISVVIGTTSAAGTGPYDSIAACNDSTTLATTTVTTTNIFATHHFATNTPQPLTRPPWHRPHQGSKLVGCREQLRNHSGSINKGITRVCPKTKKTRYMARCRINQCGFMLTARCQVYASVGCSLGMYSIRVPLMGTGAVRLGALPGPGTATLMDGSKCKGSLIINCACTSGLSEFAVHVQPDINIGATAKASRACLHVMCSNGYVCAPRSGSHGMMSFMVSRTHRQGRHVQRQ